MRDSLISLHSLNEFTSILDSFERSSSLQLRSEAIDERIKSRFESNSAAVSLFMSVFLCELSCLGQ